MCDLISDVIQRLWSYDLIALYKYAYYYNIIIISCCVWSCDMNKINVADKTMIENQKKEKIWKSIFLHKSSSNRWFRNKIHSLLSRAYSRGSADIHLPYVTHIASRYFVGQA